MFSLQVVPERNSDNRYNRTPIESVRRTEAFGVQIYHYASIPYRFYYVLERCYATFDQRSSGVNAVTSSITAVSAYSMTMRSKPRALPAASGIADNAARNLSGMG